MIYSARATEVINNVQKQLENCKLRTIVEEFIAKQNIHCAEVVWQSDRVVENSYELIQKLCEIVGYANLPEEEDD